MAAQLNYDWSTAKGLPGGKFDLADDVVNTRSNEEATGTLKFGHGVVAGASKGHSVKLPTATTDTFEGIVVNGSANVEHDLDGEVKIKKGTTVGVMKRGHIWARLASDVTAPEYGAKAYLVVTGTDAGCFTNTADGALDTGATFGNQYDDGIAVVIL